MRIPQLSRQPAHPHGMDGAADDGLNDERGSNFWSDRPAVDAHAKMVGYMMDMIKKAQEQAGAPTPAEREHDSTIVPMLMTEYSAAWV